MAQTTVVTVSYKVVIYQHIDVCPDGAPAHCFLEKLPIDPTVFSVQTSNLKKRRIKAELPCSTATIARALQRHYTLILNSCAASNQPMATPSVYADPLSVKVRVAVFSMRVGGEVPPPAEAGSLPFLSSSWPAGGGPSSWREGQEADLA